MKVLEKFHKVTKPEISLVPSPPPSYFSLVEWKKEEMTGIIYNISDVKVEIILNISRLTAA